MLSISKWAHSIPIVGHPLTCITATGSDRIIGSKRNVFFFIYIVCSKYFLLRQIFRMLDKRCVRRSASVNCPSLRATLVTTRRTVVFYYNDSSMWNKKPTRCHLVLYLFILYKLLNMFRATLCPSSGADDLVVFFHVWCSAVAVYAVRSG